MRQKNRRIKYALVLLQVGLLASAFFLFFGLVAMTLYLIGEISIAEIVDYLLLSTTWESVSLITFLEGLIWIAFKKNRSRK
ncbi:MAG: hypothetical protein KGI28_06440 [Thaumarchaeota archaeon]|nr:hypothetical protein [Nitrososphaerota archaeon]